MSNSIPACLNRQVERDALGGTLVLGGGFAGAYVARLLGKRGATIVSPQNSMLYTPLLPEAASGTLEPRHVVVPLRQMCPHAELVIGSAVSLDTDVADGRRRQHRRAARDRLRAPRRSARRDQPRLPRSRPRRARTRLQGPRRRDRAPQPRPRAARRRRGRRPGVRARVRLRRGRLCGRGGDRGAERPRPGRAAVLPDATGRAAALGARGGGTPDPLRDPAQPGRCMRRSGWRDAGSRSASGRRSPPTTARRPFSPTARRSLRARSSGRRG